MSSSANPESDPAPGLPPAPRATPDTHPKPSPARALERSKMRHFAGEGTQRLLWLGLFLVLALLLGWGIARGLGKT